MADAAPTISDIAPEPASSGRGATILIVEDDRAMRMMLREALEEDGYTVEDAGGGRAGIERVKQGGVDLVISDVKMPDLDGLDMLREIKAVTPSPHVITITAFGSIDTAIRAVKLGAFDYITKPFDVDQLILSVQKALDERALRTELARLRDEVQRSYRWGNIIGKSAAMQEMFALIRRLSGSAASVLVTGASGTGKELVAKSLHFNSPRRDRPFVAINCAAIPDTLLESELFGYKRGAFTDARTDRAGLFVEADGGTVFLDEIAELSPALQAKLLRVLQEGEIRPLGAARSQKVDVRIVAATNKDLEENLANGTFRQDLFYRLNVIHIHLPALRDRADDILPLAEHFLVRSAGKASKDVRAFHEAAKKALLAYGWPGNVRELENVVERAVALVEGPLVRVDDLPPLPSTRDRRPVEAPATEAAEADPFGGALARGLTLAELERDYIMKVLAAEGGNKTRAAQRLGLDRKTLYRKLEEYNASGSGSGTTTPGSEDDN
ncbi:MAG TPA: sigma-54 dependent transcriptional regulator [Polyangia bacterium]|jgi:two-component system response regulator PilR (NtrC family)/two-component system response regulator HydG|nr:sigma-54 dependent transcriptional regulator [Polyangia bacterium]